MKNYKILYYVFICTIIIYTSGCADDEPTPVEIQIADLSTTINENPVNGFVLGTITASASSGELSYQLGGQTPAGAMAIDPVTGEISVEDASLFNFEVNPIITATASASAEGVSETASITITLTDIAEDVIANAFTVTIDENPTDGQLLGTLSATSDAGATLTYSLITGGNATAFAIDASTGELTVADVSQFDFETNPSLTATYEADNGNVSEQGTITVTLNDVDEADPNSFVVIVKTTSDNQFVATPTNGGSGYNYNVKWGDGSSENGLTFAKTHEYATEGTYEIEISGDFPAFIIGKNSPITEIKQWGNYRWQTMARAFAETDGLILPSENPDLSAVIDMSELFQGAKNVSDEIMDWDVSAVEDFSYAISSIGTSSTVNINVDISGWDMSNAKNLTGMFFNNGTFNQDISGWDVSSATKLSNMFYGSTAFNQDLSGWDVSRVESMSAMFRNASAFDQDISSWDISNVTNISTMFFGATAFNKNISGWDVAQVTNMSSMFAGAIAFDQNLGGWNLSSATDLSGMLNDSGLSKANYNATLNGWANNASTPDNLTLGAFGLEYTDTTSRNKLTNDKNWIINGDFINS